MIAIYDNLRKMADAIADSADVQAFCVQHFGRGCLVQVDDIADAPITSNDAPWVIVAKGPSGELGPVADETGFVARIACGVSTPVLTFHTVRERTTIANGLRILPGGDKAEGLLRRVIEAIKSANYGEGIMVKAIGLDVDVYTLSPLQLAMCDVEVKQTQSLSDW